MTGAIISIFNAMASWSLTANGKTVKVRNYDGLKEQFQAADAPTRMLMVPTGGTEARHGEFISMADKLQHVTWTIEDRLYLQPVEAGKGIADYSALLVEYARDYLEAVRDNRAPTSQSTITDVRVLPMIVRWPDIEGGEPYAGARCLVRVEEWITGA